MVQSQPSQIVHETLTQKTNKQKKTPRQMAGGMAQGVDLEFKLQYHTHQK
jgi:hypothetical protein